MNVGGHVAVARRLHGDADLVWLGAALPDLATMGGHRLLGHSPDPAVTSGIALHHATDDAFHRHPTFTGLMDLLRPQLAADGLGRGAARAVAHVGPELLIDGALLRRSVEQEATERALAAIDDADHLLADLVVDERRTDWLHHLGRARSIGLPDDYHDPAAVARRLHRILARRPRLAFDADLVPAVAERLEAVQPTITDTTDDLVEDLVRELGDGSSL